MNEKTTIKDGGPAFPYSVQRLQSSYHQEVKGMSIRDWFAGQALAGDMANDAEGVFGNDAKDEYLLDRARLLFRLADAMLAAREVKL